ncbi:MAG: hypothetical protein ACLFRZ_12325 [Rhodosalinus sp.]
MPDDTLTFLAFLQDFRRGDLMAEADRQFIELMEAIDETGGKGELTLKLPVKINDAGQIECVPQLTIKKPRRPIGTGIYYLTPEGRLSRRDPKQTDMLDELEARRTRNTDQ